MHTYLNADIRISEIGKTLRVHKNIPGLVASLQFREPRKSGKFLLFYKNLWKTQGNLSFLLFFIIFCHSNLRFMLLLKIYIPGYLIEAY